MENRSEQNSRDGILAWRMAKRKIPAMISACISLFWLFIISSFAMSCKSKLKLSVEAALIGQDWQKVSDACKLDDSMLAKPETIGILGHAAIMLNKNNASYILLTTLNTDNTRRKGWQCWTDSFVHHYPKSAIPYYLQGDAYVRNGNYEKAIESFNKAIHLDSNCSLAYNARGLLYALINDNRKSLSDLNYACKLDPTVSDYLVNRGTLYYNNRTAETAVSDFTNAKNISPDNAFALNGEVCAKLFDFNEKSNKYLFDSVIYQIYKAREKLNIPIFNENIHSLLYEIESRVYPSGQEESPFFRVSDFFNWNALLQKSTSDKYDLFRTILNETLPVIIDAKSLVKLNSLLLDPNLFKNYLANALIPDSLRKIVSKARTTYLANKKGEKDSIQCLNRYIFEKFYLGLIAPFRLRDPGMNINTSFSDLMEQYAANTRSDAFTARQTILDQMGVNFSFGGNNYSASIGSAERETVYDFATIAEAGALMSQISETNLKTQNINDQTLAQLDKYSNMNPIIRAREMQGLQGGAITDIKRQYTDNGAPYFLQCINGLGYEKK